MIELPLSDEELSVYTFYLPGGYARNWPTSNRCATSMPTIWTPNACNDLLMTVPGFMSG